VRRPLVQLVVALLLEGVLAGIREVLERRRAHVLGLTLTAVDARSSDEYYYYGSYYWSYYKCV